MRRDLELRSFQGVAADEIDAMLAGLPAYGSELFSDRRRRTLLRLLSCPCDIVLADAIAEDSSRRQ